MSDRLEEIKERAADPKIPWQKADVMWLMDEVERLRAERYVDSEVVVLRGEVDVLVTAAIAKDAEIERLRGALQSLVDATSRFSIVCDVDKSPWWESLMAARAVAVAVLTGQADVR